ncbi:MAG: S-layer homology domain-containing protein [Rothia sp.]|uniref:S8 family serine peptidase n=1 Tax=Rothia sp. (in: high G+C Gram-positive bacteria) TaxID=1885016 RepID=UPI001CAC3733|nr:S8 family serine peptidase [Rothia sp. (in: high G+C Gram-positive bacteria)]MBF1676566.1 S-layer homology domain-containing protein [Rothia sp. (in: high G+C Gram-positive bacteria)]
MAILPEATPAPKGSRPPRGLRRVARGCGALVLGLTLGLTSLPFGTQAYAAPGVVRGDVDAPRSASAETPNPTEVLSPSLDGATGERAVFVRFKGQGAYAQTQPDAVRSRAQAPVNAQAQVQAIRASVQQQGASAAKESGAQVLYTTHNTMRGVALYGNVEQIRALANRSDVERISIIEDMAPQNTGSVLDTDTLSVWAQQHAQNTAATGYTGKGVKIVVLDTGIDYTHADLGGPGTKEAYEKAKASDTIPEGTYDPKKFLGGYDLVGDDYNSAKKETSTPHPDANPLDCGGHGSHVAGTAAGYGVNADGSTFRGDYSKLTEEQLKDMKIGPGSAPDAQLIGLRIFGCKGTTAFVPLGLDRVLDPNDDGDFSDRADIANLSLGNEFGVFDETVNYAVGSLYREGILSVVAAGNANNYNAVGDTYSNSGGPGTSAYSLTVANSIGSTQMADRVKILSPANEADTYGDYSVSFDYSKATEEQLRGTVVRAATRNRYACEAFTEEEAAALKGKWALIDWAEADGTAPCGSRVRFDNLQAAGATGVVIASDTEVGDTAIGGNSAIPGVRLAKSQVERLSSQIDSGNLTLQLGENLRESIRVQNGKLDQANTSTARGMHGSHGITKPDVAAPGTNISSILVGGGTEATVKTGTSMSTPFVAGVAALIMQAHPEYGPRMIKTAIMNTADHRMQDAWGNPYAVDRVGTGRINTRAAVADRVMLFNAARPEQVSDTFGVLEYTPNAGVQTLQHRVSVENTDSVAHTYAVSYDGSMSIPGVEFSYPQSVSVGAGQTATFTVTVRIDPSKLEKTIDPSMYPTQDSLNYSTGMVTISGARQYIASASGRLILTDADSSAAVKTLRMPLHVAPKPVSALRVAGADIHFDSNGAGALEQRLSVEGTAVNQGGYRSLLGAFELGASSPRIPTAKLGVGSDSRMDLQYVGATSNVAALKAAGQDTSQAQLSFGISTWGNWSEVTPRGTYYVFIDTDKDGTTDYRLQTVREKGLDYPLVKVSQRGLDGKWHAIANALYPLNGTWGDTDTNIMDSNTLVMSVPLSVLGLDPEAESTEISYSVTTASAFSATTVVDTTESVSFNYATPALWFSGDSAGVPNLFVDAPGTNLVAHRSGEAKGSALFLHMHNATGDLSGVNGAAGERAQVLRVSSSSEAPAESAHFKDVPADYPFVNDINWLAQRRITTGYPDGTFRPNGSVERGAMAAFFYRMAGSPQFTAPSTPSFKDVPRDHPFYKEIEWMRARGITTGWSDGTFRPNDAVNRDAMAAFFYRFAGSPAYSAPAVSPFSDVSTGSQFYREIAWLADQRITTGWPDGSFRPVQPIERGAMAAFLHRYNVRVLNNR